MHHPIALFAAAAASLAAWVVLTFVLALASGWTHVALVVGVFLVVAGIVAADARAEQREPDA